MLQQNIRVTFCLEEATPGHTDGHFTMHADTVESFAVAGLRHVDSHCNVYKNDCPTGVIKKCTTCTRILDVLVCNTSLVPKAYFTVRLNQYHTVQGECVAIVLHPVGIFPSWA